MKVRTCCTLLVSLLIVLGQTHAGASTLPIHDTATHNIHEFRVDFGHRIAGVQSLGTSWSGGIMLERQPREKNAELELSGTVLCALIAHQAFSPLAGETPSQLSGLLFCGLNYLYSTSWCATQCKRPSWSWLLDGDATPTTVVDLNYIWPEELTNVRLQNSVTPC